jgi:hypothetical protein
MRPLSVANYLLCRVAVVATLLIGCSSSLSAQQGALYTYNDLSHVFYEKEIDSIEENWTCPKLFTAKATQKMYREIWDNRTKYITNRIANRTFVHDSAMLAYLQGIIDELIAANPSFKIQPPLLLLDRSAAPNAYTPGGNIVAFTLGMYAYLNTREEIALTIAHELSHILLGHSDRFLKEKAEWLTSDEYKEALNHVLDSKYNRYSRLMGVFKEQSFSSSRHSRYHEQDADSLAIVLLKGARIPFDPNFFLRLDSTDRTYLEPLNAPLKQYFAHYALTLNESWCQKRGRGLSNTNYSFATDSKMDDSLKTHPECKERYEVTLRYRDANASYTPIPKQIREKATKMLIWSMYDDRRLTRTLYRVFREKDKGSTDVWYDFMVHNIMGELAYKDKKLARFNVVGIMPKEEISKSYYELQTLLEQIPKESLETYYKGLSTQAFWDNMPKDAVALKNLIHSIATGPVDNDPVPAMKGYMATYPNSMYKEYVDNFNIKK